MIVMEIEHLRAFLTVVGEGHFGAAADYLRLPQPTLSRRIQRLEQVLGAELVVRTVRPVVPTAAGRLLVGYAKDLVETADAADAALRSFAAGQGQIVRIGYVQSATFGWIGRLAKIAVRRGLEIELVAAPGLRQLEAMRQHRLEAGLVRPASLGSDLTGMKSKEISQDPLYGVLANTHQLAGSDLTPDQLAQERLLLYPEGEGPGLRRLLENWLTGNTDRLVVQEAWDAASAVALAAAGVGVAVLPGPLPPLPAGVVARELPNSPRLSLALVWHPSNDLLVSRLASDLGSRRRSPRPAR